MIVIAHRGANREALENSWSAFDKALEGGASRIELDLQLTRDAHPVVMHDHDLSRCAGQAKLVSQMDRADLEQIPLINGEAIPFLDQVLERLLPRAELNLELKGNSQALARQVASLLKSHPHRERVIASSFHSRPLVALRQLAPALRRACLWGFDTFSWPYFANMAPQLFLETCGADILHPHYSFVTANLMDQAVARSWQVYAWSDMNGEEGDREGVWVTMTTYGVDGLCTNYPRQLNAWLEEVAFDGQHHDHA